MPTQPADFKTPHDHIQLDHGKLAYWRFGSGPDVVFVHGWPLHGATWRRIVPAIAEHFTCHIFDLPGTGHTSWDADAPVGMWEHAHTLDAALKEINVQKYALIAHDSGGTIARLLATIDGNDVTGIVMGNTEIPGHSLPMLQWAKVGAKVPGAANLVSLVTRSKKAQREMFKGCFDLSELDTDFHDYFVAPLTRDVDAVRGQLRLVENLDWNIIVEELGAVHQKISAPVLLIWGDKDPWFPWDDAKAMVDSFAGPPAEVHLIAGGRLFVHEESADEFAERTIEFLTQTA